MENILSGYENNAVKIAVRECPPRQHLKADLQSSVISYHPNGKNIIVNESVFTFDHILHPTSSQRETFDKLIKPLVISLKLGFNCTALAYGQTGTGKSYTMGLNSNSCDDDSIGVIPRCLKELFSMIKSSNNQENNEIVLSFPEEFQIYVSFVEIYNEKVYDLLGENVNEPMVRGYKYTGGTRKPLINPEDCYSILKQGNNNRHVRPTKMNAQSSRSHAIFTIHVRSKSQKVNGEDIVTTSCLNIVDLAGSEGVRRTGHQGVAMSEGVHINQGLLSVGKVLQALTSGSKVIPYRDSVLTSVLQESLNSNSFLTFLACVSPHREDLSETLSTLRFAQSAKLLKNRPEINNIVADIRKNAKLKQTPYKRKPLEVCNNTLFGIKAQSAVKSHTFCTPKKQRIEVNKCNQTEISSNCPKPKLSSDVLNLPKMIQFNSTHNRESVFNKSLESNGSLLSLNISSSTTGHSNAKISPIIRKCMAEFKTDFEANLLKMFQNKLQPVPITPAPATPKILPVMPSTIRQELKSIIKEVLFENSTENSKRIKKCQLFNNSGELFKIPEDDFEFRRPITSSPINNTNLSRTNANFAQTFFFCAANTADNTVLSKSKRRSLRIAQKRHEQSLCSDDPVINASVPCRRRSRQSILQIQQNKRRSIRLIKQKESVEDKKRNANSNDSGSDKKITKTTKLNSKYNTIIDGFMNGSVSTNITTNLIKHRKAVLDILNRGNMKDLQTLPQIGQKTAYQIVTQRTLIGKFKNWNQVKKLPIWRGTAYERFAKANMIA